MIFGKEQKKSALFYYLDKIKMAELNIKTW